jgi:hypothetical protein
MAAVAAGVTSAGRAKAAATGSPRTAVTTVRSAGAATGKSAAVTSFASLLERWKNRGRTSARFSGVSTFASSTMLVMHSLPSRSASRTSG